MNEFDIIRQYFIPLTRDREEARGLEDDAAFLNVPEGFELVVTTDAVNEGVHFFSGEDPQYVAHKALRANLSDLAAKGAKGWCYQLSLALPEDAGEDWLQAFTRGLTWDQAEFGVFLCGGDTTMTKGPASVAITAFGLVPRRAAVHRSGAGEGDLILLTGTIGDAHIGWKTLEGKIEKNPDSGYFKSRFRFPEPRTEAAEAVREFAHACIDISDGLVADLGHICAASAVAAVVELEKLTLSPPARRLLSKKLVKPQDLLTGGEDYELLMAVAPENAGALQDALQIREISSQIIGQFRRGDPPEVCVIDTKGKPLKFRSQGWRHFS